MINIPLPFYAMWIIMLCGVLTNILARVNAINHRSPDNILWYNILKKFFQKEWASYGMSVIFTGIVAYSFVFMKQFEKVDNAEITRWAKWIPLAVIVLYFFGVLNQWIFYKILGRIQSKGQVDVEILKEQPKP
jgi:hypothetical protein